MNGLPVLGCLVSGALEFLEDRVKLGIQAFLCSRDITRIFVCGDQGLEACKTKAVSASTRNKDGTSH